MCGSTIATYFASVALRKKISVTDIANATLAGGVAIGSTCVLASMPVAILIGVLAGVLATIGYAVIQPKLQGFLKSIDTCGVTNLHGMPGLFGGIAAIVVVAGINVSAQLAAIGLTLLIGIGSGVFAGKLISQLGTRLLPYEDAEEFLEE